MQTIAAYLIAEHIHDLIRDADAARLANAVARPKGGPNRLRRRIGQGLRRLSGVLADLARWFDPALRWPSYGRE